MHLAFQACQKQRFVWEKWRKMLFPKAPQVYLASPPLQGVHSHPDRTIWAVQTKIWNEWPFFCGVLKGFSRFFGTDISIYRDDFGFYLNVWIFCIWMAQKFWMSLKWMVGRIAELRWLDSRMPEKPESEPPESIVEGNIPIWWKSIRQHGFIFPQIGLNIKKHAWNHH